MAEISEALVAKVINAGRRAAHAATQSTRYERALNLRFIHGEPYPDLRRAARFMMWADTFAEDSVQIAARAALEAAADDLRADAWDEGHDACMDWMNSDDDSEPQPMNPYRKQTNDTLDEEDS